MSRSQKINKTSAPQLFRVVAEYAGTRLDRYLKEALGNTYSLAQIRWAIEHHFCRINQKVECFVSTKLRLNDLIELQVSVIPSLTPATKVCKLSDILFEDEALLIYNKPAGISCDEGGLFKIIRDYHRYSIPIHRLDKETTGAILFAKQEVVRTALLEQFKDRSIKKTYYAVVQGQPKQKKGVITNYLGRIQARHGQMVWGEVPPKQGLLAQTQWERQESGGGASMIHCWPYTGRTHQLRVHLSQIGHPILGDNRYCQHFSCPYIPPRILLHAAKLEWVHPLTLQRIETIAPLPDDLQQAINYIRENTN